MVGPATVAVESLVEAGLSGEVLDARWLAPLDVDAILGSVARTKRLVVVHESNRTGGFGGEIVATVAEHLGGELVQTPLRIGAPDIRVPAAPGLSSALLPDAVTIAERLQLWLGTK